MTIAAIDFSAVADAYAQVAKFGFGALLFTILVGSYFDVWRWGRACREKEKKDDAELAEIKKAAAEREKSQQDRIDQLMDRMVEAANLVAISARQVRR